MMGAMDHDEVRELLQDAAVEPGGLDRLMAGDTPTAAVVAGHLAGCAECSDEMERLRRSVGVIRPAVQAVPPAELRQKTLDYVAALGRPRGGAAAASEPARQTRVSGNRLRTLAALAAALIVAVTGTALVVGGGRDAVVRGQAAEIEALGDVARWTIRVEGKPDVRRVPLASTSGGPTTGTLLFSPSSTELVVVSDDLTAPPANHEYRCWVDVGGNRRPIGKMFFGGDLAYWVGDVPDVAGLPADASFGVSLIDLSAQGVPGQPVLTGTG
jgi:anti-sigma-K factor RskA